MAKISEEEPKMVWFNSGKHIIGYDVIDIFSFADIFHTVEIWFFSVGEILVIHWRSVSWFWIVTPQVKAVGLVFGKFTLESFPDPCFFWLTFDFFYLADPRSELTSNAVLILPRPREQVWCFQNVKSTAQLSIFISTQNKQDIKHGICVKLGPTESKSCRKLNLSQAVVWP